jgi:1-acyl-sn-glycerol-3-phosphate acyltransferase
MARAGYISIDRSDRRSAHKSLLEAARKIAGGVSVVIFPEGSRSTDGRIRPFKAGGFHLAIRSGRPIVPVVISGAREVMPKGRLRIRPGHICVSVHSPIDTTSYKDKAKKDLMERVHSIMEQDLEQQRATEP